MGTLQALEMLLYADTKLKTFSFENGQGTFPLGNELERKGFKHDSVGDTYLREIQHSLPSGEITLTQVIKEGDYVYAWDPNLRTYNRCNYAISVRIPLADRERAEHDAPNGLVGLVSGTFEELRQELSDAFIFRGTGSVLDTYANH